MPLLYLRGNLPALLRRCLLLLARRLANADARVRQLFRLLRLLHGRPLLHLPCLLPAHQPDLRHRLHRRLPWLPARRRLLLDDLRRQPHRRQTARRGRWLLLRRGHDGMVSSGRDPVHHARLAVGIEQPTGL